jgi:hypothetical protein
MQIEVNYFNANKPKGVVGGTPTVPLNTSFSFFSHDGRLEVLFVDDSPVTGDLPPQKHAENTPLVASKAGHYHFQCFINGNLVPIGGELDIPPAM